MSCLHALPSVLVYWFVLFCILSNRFVISRKREREIISGALGVGKIALPLKATSPLLAHPHTPGRKQVSKRSTHARPGMHMQQCSAVPCDHWYDTNVLPHKSLHLLALFCQHKSVYMLQDKEGTLMLLSFTRVTLRLLALLGQVTWTGTVCFRGRKWGRGATSGTRAAYSPLNGLVGCEGAGGPASIVKRSDHDLAFLRSESTCAGFGPCTAAAVQPAAAPKTAVRIPFGGQAEKRRRGIRGGHAAPGGRRYQ